MSIKYIFFWCLTAALAFVGSNGNFNAGKDVVTENGIPPSDRGSEENEEAQSESHVSLKSAGQATLVKSRNAEDAEAVTPEKNICEESMKSNTSHGSINSPNYPHDYPDGVSCLWAVKAPPNHVVVITFKDFQLESGIKLASSCPFDFLYIFEEFLVDAPINLGKAQKTGPVRYRQNIGTYCGNAAPETLRSKRPGSTVYLYFRADESKTARGFMLEHELVKIPSSSTNITHPWLNNNNLDDFAPSLEEEFLKIFAVVVFAFVFITICLGTLYKCWKTEQLTADGRAVHSCCFGLMRLDVVSRGNSTADSRLHQHPSSPMLPTPPPEYGDVVKTEDDWNRVIQQLGEASALALRRQMETEDVQVTYDLSNDDVTTDSSVTSRIDQATQPTSLRDATSPEVVCVSPASHSNCSTSPLITGDNEETQFTPNAEDENPDEDSDDEMEMAEEAMNDMQEVPGAVGTAEVARDDDRNNVLNETIKKDDEE